MILVGWTYDGWRRDEDRIDLSVQSYFFWGSTDCVRECIVKTCPQSIPPPPPQPWASHVSRKSARHKHWDVCCNRIPTPSFKIWRMLLHSHSTTFHHRCQVSCLRVSWPLAPSHSVRELLATSLCVVRLVPASHIDLSCWWTSLLKIVTSLSSFARHSNFGTSLQDHHTFPLLLHFVTPVFFAFDTYPWPCLHPWLSCALWHNRSHQKRQGVLSRTQLVKTNQDRRGPWTKPRTRLRTSEIKPRSWTVGNHCPSRRTPPNWDTGCSR